MTSPDREKRPVDSGLIALAVILVAIVLGIATTTVVLAPIAPCPYCDKGQVVFRSVYSSQPMKGGFCTYCRGKGTQTPLNKWLRRPTPHD
ncbi:MAG: hypothetical protein HY293_05875 [Planctomycetes bacterium]|nr:hypothetical protein [Planctomycetota bacterium]